jgi:hypothetical protein
MRLIGTAFISLAGLILLAAPAEARKHDYVYGDTYTNSSGHQVHRPMRATSPPAGWTAQCRDGSYSFSEHHRGTCSRHGGVASWR